MTSLPPMRKLPVLFIIKKFNSNLEKRVATLEKLQAKTEQYNKRNDVEISGLPNHVLDNDPEDKVTEICKDSDIVIASSHIEGCHCLPLGRNSTCKKTRVIVKFVHRKHSKLMLRLKKNILITKYILITRYANITVFYGGSVKSFKERVKYINFCSLGRVVTVRVR